MREEDFPRWAREQAREAIGYYLGYYWHSSPEIDSIQSYRGIWEHPLKDGLYQEYANQASAKHSQWGNEFKKLLTDDRAIQLWAAVEKIGIPQKEFIDYARYSFLDGENEKLSLGTPSERKAYLEEVRDLAATLASRLAGMRYDDATTTDLRRKLYSAITNLSEDDQCKEGHMGKIEVILDLLVMPLSFQLGKLTETIDQDLHSGDYLYPIDKTQGTDGTDYPARPPLVIQKHKDREGERTKFYKGLARRLNDATGNPRPTVVAITASIIYSDLGDITPNYISKTWKT